MIYLPTNKLKAALLIAPKNDRRLALNGVRIVIASDHAMIYATDGKIVYYDRCLVCSDADDIGSVTLPTKQLADAIKGCKGDAITLAKHGDGVIINGSHIIKPLDGVYPQIDSVKQDIDHNHQRLVRDYDFELLALAQKAIQTGIGTKPVCYLQHDAVAMMYCIDENGLPIDYPVCAVVSYADRKGYK